MVQTTIDIIKREWIEQLFQNQHFTTRLKSFLKQQQYQPKQSNLFISSSQTIDELTSQITQLISQHMLQQIQLQTQNITIQISKINNQIGILKNYMFGSCEKLDLQSTCYNRSKLQLSSILEQDAGVDIMELKSTLTELQQRMNQWFGNRQEEKYLNLYGNSKLTVQIYKTCNEIVSNLETKIKQRFQSTDQFFQKRIQLISKTLNNVLEMINQNPLKDQFYNDQFAGKSTIKQKQSPKSNSNSLLRQSSLQNMKLKNLFSFGKR